MGQKKLYVVMNMLVLILTIAVFFRYFDVDSLKKIPYQKAGILLLTAVVVHGLKAFRLYFALYGKGLSFGKHMKQYSKVAIVSMVLPFKVGDIFRAYCYGSLVGSYYGGAVLILLDRFADTLALVTMMLLMQAIGVSQVVPLLYALLAVLFGILVCYLAYPDIYRYWKRYFLRLDASKGRNRMLKSMDYLDHAYGEIAAVVKGRGMVLYVLSLTAWTMEIGGLILNKIVSGRQSGQAVSAYLMAALAGTESAHLRQFVAASVVLMAVWYLLLCAAGIFKKGDLR